MANLQVFWLSFLACSASALDCPSGFSTGLSPDVCTLIRAEPQVTWCEANRLCGLMAAELVTHSGAITALAGYSARLWIGAADLADERDNSRTGWRLVNGRGAMIVADTVWRSGRPNNLGGNQDCLLVKESFGLDDVGCTELAGIVCQLIPSGNSAGASPAGNCHRRRSVWQGSQFNRRSPYNSPADYCQQLIIGTGGSVRHSAQVCALRASAAASADATYVASFLYNRVSGDCRLLLYTDSEVEQSVETDPDWEKYIYTA